MRRSWPLLSVALSLYATTCVGQTLSPIYAGERTYGVPVRTLQEMRLRESFRTTIRQQFDFSCGSAAIATLLTFHYGRPVSEKDVFEVMFAGGDRERIRREGFSLLDMKRYLEQVGYQADGYEISLDELAGSRIPAIALVRENGYNHFVVVKGIEGARVLIGDPSSGTRILSRRDFETLWAVRILFVVRSHLEAARFNQAAEWSFRLRMPVGEALLRDSTATAQLMRPGYSDF
jgi:uncharacterized protein